MVIHPGSEHATARRSRYPCQTKASLGPRVVARLPFRHERGAERHVRFGDRPARRAYQDFARNGLNYPTQSSARHTDR